MADNAAYLKQLLVDAGIDPATVPGFETTSQESATPTPGATVSKLAKQAVKAGTQQIRRPQDSRTTAPLRPAEASIARQTADKRIESRTKQAERLADTALETQAIARGMPQAAARAGADPATLWQKTTSAIGSVSAPVVSALGVIGSNLDRPVQGILGGALAALQGRSPLRGAQEAVNYPVLSSHLDKRINLRDILHNELGWQEGHDWGPLVARIAASFGTLGISELAPMAGRERPDFSGMTPHFTTLDAMGIAGEFGIDPMTLTTIGASKKAFALPSGRTLNKAGRAAYQTLFEAAWLGERPGVAARLREWGAPQLATSLEQLAASAKDVLAAPSPESIKALAPRLGPVFRDAQKLIGEKLAAGGKPIANLNETGRGVFPFEGMSISQSAHERAGQSLERMLLDRKTAGLPSPSWEDPGGLKFAGRTVIPGTAVEGAAKAAGRGARSAVAHTADLLQRFEPTQSIGRSLEAAPHALSRTAFRFQQALSDTWGLPRGYAREYTRNFIWRLRGGDTEIVKRVVKLLSPFSKAELEAITESIDSGQLVNYLSDKPDWFADRVYRARNMMDDAWAELVSRGMVDPNSYRPNYVFHHYLNTKRVKQILLDTYGADAIQKWRDPSVLQRLYPTLDAARRDGLEPEMDFSRLLTMRLVNANRAIVQRDHLKAVADKFGLPRALADVLKRSLAGPEDIANAGRVAQETSDWLSDLMRSTHDAQPEGFSMVSMLQAKGIGQELLSDRAHYPHIGYQLAWEGATPLKIVSDMPPDLRREFFRHRFLKVGSMRELRNVEKKYADYREWWPKGEAGTPLANAYGLPSAALRDGEWVPVRLPHVGVSLLPERIAKKLIAATQDGRLFTDTGKPIADILSVMDKWYALTRKAYTSIWPSFHHRNLYTTAANSALDIGLSAIDPVNWHDAAQVMSGNRNHVIVTANGQRYTGDELRRLYARNGLWVTFDQVINAAGGAAAERAAQETARHVHPFGKAAVGSIAKRLNLPPAVESAMRRSATGLRYLNPFNLGGLAGNLIENEVRAMHFTTLVKDGVPPSEAAARTLTFTFDYASRPPLERHLLKRLMLFPTWTVANLKLQAEMALRKPRYLVNALRIHESLRDEKTPPERAIIARSLLPTYVKGEFGLAMTPEQGDHVVRWLTPVEVPAEDLNQLWEGDLRRTYDQWAGMMAPLPETMASLIDWQIGQRGTRVPKLLPEDGPAFDIMRVFVGTPLGDWLDLKWEVDKRSGREHLQVGNAAKLRFLTSVLMIQRPLREMSRFSNPDQSAWWGLAGFLSGAKQTGVDPDEEIAARQQSIGADAIDQFDQMQEQILMQQQRQRWEERPGPAPTP